MATEATQLSNPLAGLQKYFDLAAGAAIAVQQVAKEAPGETKLGLALNFVNVGLSAVATALPAAAPILSLAAGLESPFASLISGIVGLFKHHGVNGFTKGQGSAQAAPVAIAAAVPASDASAWDSGAKVGG